MENAVAGSAAEDTLVTVRETLAGRSEVAFAYVHGSVLTSSEPHDVDVAVFLRLEAFERFRRGDGVDMGFAIPLEMELDARLRRKADVHVMNAAPLTFRHRVISTGTCVVDRDQALRVDFECLTRCEYFDFRPRKEEYFARITA